MPTLGTWSQGWVSTLKEGTCNFAFERNWGANEWEVPRRLAARWCRPRPSLDLSAALELPQGGCCGAGTQPPVPVRSPVGSGATQSRACGLCAQPRNFTFSLARRAWLSGLNVSPVRVKRNATFSRILKQPRPLAQRTEIVHTIHSCLSRVSTGKLIFSSAHAEVPSRLPGWAGASVIRL